jgi:hypothetical protein
MKTMTCKQLGGACDKKFHAKTFEAMAELSKKHGMEMYKKRDDGHMKAINEMRKRMGDSQSMKEWMLRKQKEFDALPVEK